MGQWRPPLVRPGVIVFMFPFPGHDVRVIVCVEAVVGAVVLVDHAVLPRPSGCVGWRLVTIGTVVVVGGPTLAV